MTEPEDERRAPSGQVELFGFTVSANDQTITCAHCPECGSTVGTIGAGSGPMITNPAFIRLAFAKAPPGASAWVTGFAEDPHVADHRRWHGRAVVGGLPWCIKPCNNNFFAISSFRAGADGVVHRRKENFAACHVIMVDDVGTKIPEFRLELDPSYLLETSPGNHQAGYLLDPPETDRVKVERLLDAMVGSGLAMDGADPGMRGVTRYARLPVGQNNKSKYVGQMGAPFVHQVASWAPELTYTVDQIAEAYGLDLTPRVIPFHTARTEARPGAKGILSRLSAADLYIGPISGRPGAHRISCPWIHLHTDRDDTGTAYFEPSPDNCWSGGFVCHHGHCQTHDISTLIRFLSIYERMGKEDAGHG